MRILNEPRLEEVLEDWKERDVRAAAQIAYALAILRKRDGDLASAQIYGRESIRLFQQAGVESLEDAVPIWEEINGVLMPELIHENVVARDLDLKV